MSAKPTRISLTSGGWIIALSLGFVLLVIIWAMSGIALGHRRVGDGRTVESYGFDLSNLRVPRSSLVASGLARDALPPLDDPEVVDGRDVPALNATLRRKLVVAGDRVLGLVVDGVARAYPLRVLNGHEVVNDTIAGVPVVVSYSPLCDSAVVFRRTIDGRAVRFGASGLLLCSNLVMYDREGAQPSLWSQLGMAAISGPMAGTSLEPLEGVAITTWAAWLSRHPSTQIIRGDLASSRRYTSVSYARYFGDGTLLFPAEPLPAGIFDAPTREPPGVDRRSDSRGAAQPTSSAEDHLRPKSPMVALRLESPAGRWSIVSSDRLVELLSAGGDPVRDGEGVVVVDGVSLRVAFASPSFDREPVGVMISRLDGEPLLTVPVLWFAWRAFHGDAALSSRATASHRAPSTRRRGHASRARTFRCPARWRGRSAPHEHGVS